MNIDEVKNVLVATDRIMEALEIIIPFAKSLSGGMYNEALQFKARMENIQNSEMMLGDSDIKERNKVRLAILDFLSQIEHYVNKKGDINAYCQDFIVNVNDIQLPFVDRIRFRQLLMDNMQSDGAKLIFVKGVTKSGMSYLENYLIHLCKINPLYNLVRINVPVELEDPELTNGVSLAKSISIVLNLDIDWEITEKDQFKFTRFVSKLKEAIEKYSTIPIVFMHDFHKMSAVPPDINKFILKIADAFIGSFPKTIFIIAGLELESLPNWSDLKRFFPVYDIENINQDNIRDCLRSIFKSYNQDIERIMNQQLNEDVYIATMLAKLVPDTSKIDIASVGSSIADHLYTLHQH